MNRWIGEKDDFSRARCSTQDFALLISQDVVSLQSPKGHPLFPTFTAASPLSMLEWIVTTCLVANVSWMVQLQAEGGMQSNTDRLCLLIPFTSAPNTWQNRNQVFPDAGYIDNLAIGAKKFMRYIANSKTHPRTHPTDENWYKHDPIFQLYRSTRLLLGHFISSKCSHYHQTTLHVDWRSLHFISGQR